MINTHLTINIQTVQLQTLVHRKMELSIEIHIFLDFLMAGSSFRILCKEQEQKEIGQKKEWKHA